MRNISKIWLYFDIVYVASTGKKLGSIFTGCSENSVNQGCRQRSIKYLEKARIPKTNRITVSMNGKYPLETRSAVLCLVKREAEIQVKKKQNCSTS